MASRIITAQVYGFTIDTKELFKLILAKLAHDPEWAGEYAVREPEDDDEEPWTTDEGEMYEFYDFPEWFILGGNHEAYVKIRELFPDLPTGFKVFYNPLEHSNTWHIGVEISRNTPKKIQPIDHVILERYSDKIAHLFTTYYDKFVEKDGTPFIFKVTNDCTCCS